MPDPYLQFGKESFSNPVMPTLSDVLGRQLRVLCLFPASTKQWATNSPPAVSLAGRWWPNDVC